MGGAGEQKIVRNQKPGHGAGRCAACTSDVCLVTVGRLVVLACAVAYNAGSPGGAASVPVVWKVAEEVGTLAAAVRPERHVE